MKALLISLILPSLLLLTACSDKVDTYEIMSGPQPPPPPMDVFNPGRVSESGSLKKDGFNPKLEVLFVIDNSTSMEQEINTLSANIDKFVDGFTKNTPYEYNVAVMSVYDHRRFRSDKFKNEFGDTEYEFDVGEFRDAGDTNFINSGESNVAGKLKKALKIGIQSHKGAGPEVEDSFSPIAAAYGFGHQKQNTDTKKNQSDFFMGKDSYKVIFIVTDASDNSKISAGELYTGLVAASGGDASKVMAFGATNKGCSAGQRDPGIYNDKIEKFLEYARPEIGVQNSVSLCSDFGSKFAAFGQSIRRRILSQNIALTKGVPDFQNPNGGDANECLKPKAERHQRAIIVCFGEQRILMGDGGYFYNAENNSLKLDDKLEFQADQKGAKIQVEYTPLNPQLRARRYGSK